MSPAVESRLRAARAVGGFLTVADLAMLKADTDGRLTQVLVRAGGCRFICAAQDVDHLDRCLTAGGDYIRDVSLPVAR